MAPKGLFFLYKLFFALSFTPGLKGLLNGTPPPGGGGRGPAPLKVPLVEPPGGKRIL